MKIKIEFVYVFELGIQASFFFLKNEYSLLFRHNICIQQLQFSRKTLHWSTDNRNGIKRLLVIWVMVRSPPCCVNKRFNRSNAFMNSSLERLGRSTICFNCSTCLVSSEFLKSCTKVFDFLFACNVIALFKSLLCSSFLRFGGITENIFDSPICKILPVSKTKIT